MYNRKHNFHQWYVMALPVLSQVAIRSLPLISKPCLEVLWMSCGWWKQIRLYQSLSLVVADHILWIHTNNLALSVLQGLVRACCCWGRDRSQTKFMFSRFVHYFLQWLWIRRMARNLCLHSHLPSSSAAGLLKDTDTGNVSSTRRLFV